MMRKLLVPLALLAALAAGTLYADTKLKHPWIDQDFIDNNDAFKSILVIGVPDHPDKRRDLEEGLVKELKKIGVQATASLDIMSADTEVNKETVVAALMGTNVDAVFLTSLTRVDDVKIVTGGEPPSTMRSDRDFKLLLWQDYQGTYDQTLSAPTTKEHRLILENELYNLATETVVWAVQSYSMKPKSADKIIKSLSKQVSEQLRNDGFI
ncbi:hypothetical protein ACFL1S_02730 [Pseudomonadota bacterium]